MHKKYLYVLYIFLPPLPIVICFKPPTTIKNFTFVMNSILLLDGIYNSISICFQLIINNKKISPIFS